MARPRKQTYTLEMYLKKNMKGDIDNNADVQRNFVWKNEQINEKDSFVFLTLFDRFTKLGMKDEKFADFLRVFRADLRDSRRNEKGLLFDEIDKELSTKDKQVIADKLDLLEKLMLDFLHAEAGESGQTADASFIAENLEMSIEEVKDNMDFYKESLDDLTSKSIKDGSKLLHRKNRKSLLAMMAYSYKEYVDLDDWLAEYAKCNHTYFADQKKNFMHMKNDFERWQRECGNGT